MKWLYSRCGEKSKCSLGPPPPVLTFFFLFGFVFPHNSMRADLLEWAGSVLTGTRPNKARGSDDVSHVTPPELSLLRPAMCLRCFRPWRLAGLPIHPKLTVSLTEDHPHRLAVTPKSTAFVHAPESATQKAQGNLGAAVCSWLARSPLWPNMGFLPAIYGNVRHVGVYIKPGILCQTSWQSPSSRRQHLSLKTDPKCRLVVVYFFWWHYVISVDQPSVLPEPRSRDLNNLPPWITPGIRTSSDGSSPATAPPQSRAPARCPQRNVPTPGSSRCCKAARRQPRLAFPPTLELWQRPKPSCSWPNPPPVSRRPCPRWTATRSWKSCVCCCRMLRLEARCWRRRQPACCAGSPGRKEVRSWHCWCRSSAHIQWMIRNDIQAVG